MELGRFERLIGEISAGFANIPAGQVDQTIADALRRIAAVLNIDAVNIVRFTADFTLAEVAYCSGPVQPDPAGRPRRIDTRYPWGMQNMRRGLPLAFATLDDLPPEAARDRESFAALGVRSSLVLPMRVGAQIVGSMTFATIRHERDWAPELVSRLGHLVNLFGNALEHRRVLEENEAMHRFERMVTDTMASLLLASVEEQDAAIEAGLGRLGEAMGAERATLYRLDEGAHHFVKMHRWFASEFRLPPDGVLQLPWLTSQLRKGELVRWARPEDLPPEAAPDLPIIHSLGTISAIVVPLSIRGKVVAALSFATRTFVREWPDAFIPRMQLLGKVFTGLLARHASERRVREVQSEIAHATKLGDLGAIAASMAQQLEQPLADIDASLSALGPLVAAGGQPLAAMALVESLQKQHATVQQTVHRLGRSLRREDGARRRLAIGEVLADVSMILGPAAIRAGVHLDTVCALGLPAINANPAELQQILLSLGLNAFDALSERRPGERRVTIAADASSDGGIRVSVTDNGCGMSDEMLQIVFVPYYTTKGNSNGMGLTIARSLAVAHGGSLRVSSRIDVGTIFVLELPAMTEVPAQAQASDHHPC